EEFGEVLKAQDKAMEDLLSGIMVEAERDLPSDETSALKLKVHELKLKFEAVRQELIESLNQADNSASYMGPKEYQEKIGLGPMQLNNIQGPNVIQKIWSAIEGLPQIKTAGLTIEGVFGMGEDPIRPGKPQTINGHIIVLYSLLNSWGYFPDT